MHMHISIYMSLVYYYTVVCPSISISVSKHYFILSYKLNDSYQINLFAFFYFFFNFSNFILDLEHGIHFFSMGIIDANNLIIKM